MCLLLQVLSAASVYRGLIVCPLIACLLIVCLLRVDRGLSSAASVYHPLLIVVCLLLIMCPLLIMYLLRVYTVVCLLLIVWSVL